MSSLVSVEDLRLACAVARHGSLGAAARELLIAQPSASARLAALERRIGLALFDRDTTGARPTEAGVAFVGEATHILGHLDDIADRARLAAHQPMLRIGALDSLSPLVFCAMDEVLPHVSVHPRADHGPVLIGNIAEGSMDAAIICIAEQHPMPPGTTATLLGYDRLAGVVPDGAHGPPTTAKTLRKQDLKGRDVVFHILDSSREVVRSYLSSVGAQPLYTATATAALHLARQRRSLLVCSEALARKHCHPGDRVLRLPRTFTATVHVVTRSPGPPDVVNNAAALGKAMGLRRQR